MSNTFTAYRQGNDRLNDEKPLRTLENIINPMVLKRSTTVTGSGLNLKKSDLIYQIQLIFSRSKLCLATAIHNFE